MFAFGMFLLGIIIGCVIGWLLSSLTALEGVADNIDKVLHPRTMKYRERDRHATCPGPRRIRRDRAAC
jgi:hypothetical protein